MSLIVENAAGYKGGQPGIGATNPVIGGDACKSYIGYKNWLIDADGSETIANAIDWRTNTLWQPEGNTSVTVDFGRIRTVDYLALHQYDLDGGSFYLDTWDGVDWVQQVYMDELVYPLQRTKMFVFDAVETTSVRMRILDARTDTLSIGVIAVGERLEILGQTTGFNPIALSRANTIVSTGSHYAAPLGRQKVNFDQVEFDIRSRLMGSEFSLGEWRLFIDHAEQYPFFFGYNAGDWGETAFVWARDTQIPAATFESSKHVEQIVPCFGSIASVFTQDYDPGGGCLGCNNFDDLIPYSCGSVGDLIYGGSIGVIGPTDDYLNDTESPGGTWRAFNGLADPQRNHSYVISPDGDSGSYVETELELPDIYIFKAGFALYGSREVRMYLEYGGEGGLEIIASASDGSLSIPAAGIYRSGVCSVSADSGGSPANDAGHTGVCIIRNKVTGNVRLDITPAGSANDEASQPDPTTIYGNVGSSGSGNSYAFSISHAAGDDVYARHHHDAFYYYEP